MERLRDMFLGFTVYLFVLGGLYVASDRPESTEQLAETQTGSQKGTSFVYKDKNSSTLISGSMAPEAANERAEKEDSEAGILKVSTLTYSQNDKVFLNQRNFLEIIPFIEN